MSKVSLVIGAGHFKQRSLLKDQVWETVITLDMEKDTKPDIVHNLERLPWPMDSNTFDEVHAYEVLEHFGQQGDYQAFFAHFGELWRILKPNGLLFATCPAWDSLWAFGDPGHTRVISPGSLVFLQRKEYEKQLGKTPMSDYRRYLVGDWQVVNQSSDQSNFMFILRALK